MADRPIPDDVVPISETAPQSDSLVPRASTAAVWALFALSLGTLALVASSGTEWAVSGVLVVDGLTALLWTVVTFFSGVVHSYSRRYMAGDRRIDGFYARVFAFTFAVGTLAAADHLALFVAAWLAMGLVMASLVGHERDWPQARAAARRARRYFLAGGGLLAAGLAVLVWATGATTVTGVLRHAGDLSGPVALAAAGCLLLAAIVQSALFPFHRWLLSSMTAPTPASALMHAGFVNAGGVLLTRFAPLLVETPAVLSAAVVVGAVSALFGQALLLVQTDVKRELGASTVAQMGFMILQCGLGFFAAAIAHLILHGFYKAYLFLSAGGAVERTAPGKAERRDGPSLALGVVGAVTGIAGGVLFAVLTGKGTHLDAGLVLTFVVALTTLHASRDVLRRTALPSSVRFGAVPVVVLTAVGVYAAAFEAVSTVLGPVPATAAPTELSVVHVAVAALFALAYLATEFGRHRTSERLYVALLNASQPHPETILTRKEDYDDA